jgi:hypothetical protein
MMRVVALSLTTFYSVAVGVTADLKDTNVGHLEARSLLTTLPTFIAYTPPNPTKTDGGKILVDTSSPPPPPHPLPSLSATFGVPSAIIISSMLTSSTMLSFSSVPTRSSTSLDWIQTVNSTAKTGQSKHNRPDMANVYGIATGVSLAVLVLGTLSVWWVVWWKGKRMNDEYPRQ